MSTASFFWDRYLTGDGERLPQGASAARCETAFAHHKATIAGMARALSPTSVAVLGAGYLNDIPLEDLIGENRAVYLVDWIGDAPRTGVARLLLRENEGSGHRCLFCRSSRGDRYCSSFTGEFVEDGVCSAFERTDEPFVTCERYQSAGEPKFIKADITAGVARGFAERMEKHVASCSTAKGAFLKATAAAESIRTCPLPLGDDSIDLVTSSMVMSQFDFEPYGFFARLLERRFGREELERHETKLRPLMEKLRTRLFAVQVAAHVRELHRIVKKDGKARVYVSTELFRSFPGSERFFLVQDIAAVLEALNQYFYFQFDSQTRERILTASEIGDGISISQCYRLTPK